MESKFPSLFKIKSFEALDGFYCGRGCGFSLSNMKKECAMPNEKPLSAPSESELFFPF